MDRNVESVLEDFGITKNEINIYLKLLGSGELTAYEISKVTGLNRTFTYDRLKKLIDLGLVSYVVRANKKYFKASQPEIFLSLLKEKEVQISRIIPQLEALKRPALSGDTAEIFSGNKGLRTVLGSLLAENTDLRIQGSLALFKNKLSTFFELWSTRCTARKRRVMALSYDNIQLSGWQIELLPYEEANKTTTFVCGNKTVIVLWKEDPIAIQITSQTIADDQRSFFDAIWKREIRIYSGVEGIQKAFMELLENTHEYMGYGYSKILADLYSVDFSNSWHEKRITKGIRNRIISIDNAPSRSYFLPRTKQKMNFYVRFLPENLMGPACVTLSDSMIVTFIYTEKNQKIIVNKNKETINVYRKYFENLWKIAKP